jgi:hypothetical protein
MFRLSLRSRTRGRGGRWLCGAWLIDRQSEIPAFPAIAIGCPPESKDQYIARLHCRRGQINDVQPRARILCRLLLCGRPPIQAETHDRPCGQLQPDPPTGGEEINLMIESPK